MNIRGLLKPLIDRAAATAHLQGREWSPPSEWPTWTKEERSTGEGVIAEIVANLLENAFRYSSSNVPIGLYINNEGLCIWDGGKSIAFDERERIFQKGVRGENIDGLSGTGLGLALGRQLSKQIGGDLQLIVPPQSFDSLLPNEGNAFVLKFQVKE